jgi:DedD protein
MARAISDEELQLKRRARRRLIGAIVLVAAIVVVLPMVLDPEPRPANPAISVQIPSPDAGAPIAKVAPPAPRPEVDPAAAKPESVKPAESAGSVSPVVEPVAPVREQAGTTDSPPPAASPKPAARKARAAPAADGKYAVQVIALADAGRAQKVQEQIAAAGIRAYTEIVKTSKGDVTRVRAGPFESRAEAEKAREQLKSLGMNGNIVAR